MSKLPTNSLERALVILQLIGRTPGGLTNLEISREFRIARSTCTYILSRLQREGYLARDQETGKYRLGLKNVMLARGALREVGFRDASEPTLYRLAAETGLAANLAVLEGDRVLILDRIEGAAFVKAAVEESSEASGPSRPRELRGVQRLTREYRQPAYELPVCSTAIGKVLMAFMPESQVHPILDCLRAPVGQPGRTLASQKDELLAEMEQIRTQGYCMMRFEPRNESCALAAPILDASGRARAAVSVSCKRHLPIWNDELGLSEMVREAAWGISFKLECPKVIRTIRTAYPPLTPTDRVLDVEKPLRPLRQTKRSSR
jgi:DNA-binding IclR family transcriptional regulator